MGELTDGLSAHWDRFGRIDDPDEIRFHQVSRFYGDVLGVNRITLRIGPGITSLVGPNGAGKTTLMNLMTGLLRPTEGTIRVFGLSPAAPDKLLRHVGYCTQYDAFPAKVRGLDFVSEGLLRHGFSKPDAEAGAKACLSALRMSDAMHRRIEGYSKGMRQRIKLARAIAHRPRVLILDEPLNGLDPMARADVMELLKRWAVCGGFVIVASHILHEVDVISDRVVLINKGYIVAEGDISGVRRDIRSRHALIRVKGEALRRLGARLLESGVISGLHVSPSGEEITFRTADADAFLDALSRLVLDEGFVVEEVVPIDDTVEAAYHYLIGQVREEIGT